MWIKSCYLVSAIRVWRSKMACKWCFRLSKPLCFQSRPDYNCVSYSTLYSGQSLGWAMLVRSLASISCSLPSFRRWDNHRSCNERKWDVCDGTRSNLRYRTSKNHIVLNICVYCFRLTRLVFPIWCLLNPRILWFPDSWLMVVANPLPYTVIVWVAKKPR